MKRTLFLLVTIALLAGALVVAQRQRAEAEPGASSILYLVADSERDLTRLPSRFTRIPDSDEVAYGTTLADSFLAGRRTLTADEESVEKYVQDVGARLAPHAYRRIRYQFHYIPDRSFINAFALPGGHVFVGAGLLDHMTTEDELAAVMGHELEHVDHYHCVERLQVEMALRRIPFGAILQIPVAVFQAGYSKDQELEADREGVLLASRAGYSASGAVRAFEMLQELSHQKEESARTPQDEAAKVAASVLTGYFRSHPPTADRIAQIRAMIAQNPALAAPPERKLGVEYIFLAWRAQEEAGAGKFADAAALANRALQEHPGCVPAMIALCEAEWGEDQYAAAQDVYRGLLARDTSAANAVGTWAESRANELFSVKQYDREIALVESALVVQPSQPRLLRFAAWAYAMKANNAAAEQKAALLRQLYPDSVAQLASDAERSAGELLGTHSFSQSAAMARLAVEFDGDRRTARQTLGDAEFAQAHFAEAVDAYEKAFDPASPGSLADALAAARPLSASQELETFVSSHNTGSALNSPAQVDGAGLALLAGNDTKAREVTRAVDAGSVAPELLARLGWWYLRAGRTAESEAVLRKAQTLRPGDPDVLNNLAWTCFEEGKASPPGTSSARDPILENGADARAVLEAWQQGRKSDALRQWATLTHGAPQWANPAWRQAIYPARTNAIAEQIEASSRAGAAATQRRTVRRIED